MAFFVRPLTTFELEILGRTIDSISDSPDFLLQCYIILLSSQRLKSGEIARQLKISQNVVLNSIKHFNKTGLENFYNSIGKNESVPKKREILHPEFQLNLLNSLTHKPDQINLAYEDNGYIRRLRQVEKTLNRFFGLENQSLESRDELNALNQAYLVWQDQKLEESYLYIYLDETILNLNETSAKNNSSHLLAALAVKTDGQREFLAFEFTSDNLVQRWPIFLATLQKRGLKQASLWITPNSPEYSLALQAIFPGQTRGACLPDLERELQHRVNDKERRTIARRWREIYRQPNRDSALRKAQLLIADLEETAPLASAEYAQNLTDSLNYFDMPRTHWYYLKSTHTIRETFFYVKKWTKLISTPEQTLLFIFALANTLPHRSLKLTAQK